MNEKLAQLKHIASTPLGPPVHNDEILPPEPIRLTDVGNSELFVRQHAADVRYVPQLKLWLVWDSKRWKPDADGRVMMLAKETARSLFEIAARETDDARRKAIAKWAMETETERRLRSMVRLAESVPMILIDAAMLDANPLLLNVNNGTLDLVSGALRPARREDYLTKLAPVPYLPDAACPDFERMLHRLFDTTPAVLEYLQRVFGYTLTGLNLPTQQNILIKYLIFGSY